MHWDGTKCSADPAAGDDKANGACMPAKDGSSVNKTTQDCETDCKPVKVDFHTTDVTDDTKCVADKDSGGGDGA